MAELFDIWYDTIQQKPVSSESIKLVRQELKAKQIEQAVMAEAILFLRNRNRPNVRRRWLVMCGERKCDDSLLATAMLLLTLGFFTNSEIVKNAKVLDFIRRGARSPFAPARINAIRILQRLAKSGNRAAIRLLKTLLSDKDSHVKEAAQVAVKLAGISRN